jgi:hypothetical protein
MRSYYSQLRGAIEATRFHSASTIFWFGRPTVRPIPARVARFLPDNVLSEWVSTGLRDRLYRNFYCRGTATHSNVEAEQSDARAGVRAFVGALSAANCGDGYVEAGWKVAGVDGDVVRVARQGLEVHVVGDGLIHGESRCVGAEVGLRLPKEYVDRLPGFYVATGPVGWGDVDWSRVVRIYWNVTPTGARHLMLAATRVLNEAAVGYQLKILSRLDGEPRCDAAVLYVAEAEYPRLRDLLERIYRVVAPELRPGVPALTKRLAPGVALAEDPGGGVSFGQHRCTALADSLIDAHRHGVHSLDDRFRFVTEAFARRGIDVEAPYLREGSAGGYRGFALRSCGPCSPACAGSVDRRSTVEYLSLARALGARICRDAWRDGTRCNWMGARPGGIGRVDHRSLGPFLYDGTSGVAVFLAELHAVTGDDAARTTALGALEHAITRAGTMTDADRFGLFSGWSGIAWASAYVGNLCGQEGLLDRARDLAQRVAGPERPVEHFDLLAGAAGGIVALLALRAWLEDASLLGAAVRLGDSLIARARKTRACWSWPIDSSARGLHLTGLAHGTAGIAQALLELFAATGEARFRAAAECGLEYERRWFDASAQNWPDFREHAARDRRRGTSYPCGSFWCHGAPGIALSRLRAYEVTRDERWKADACIAVSTTRALTERALAAQTMNFSMCHGLAGNGEVLRAAARKLPDVCAEAAALPAAIAAAGFERYGGLDAEWPCGAGGPSPGLMVGLAGIGSFYLRFAGSLMPSLACLDVPAMMALSPSGATVRSS